MMYFHTPAQIQSRRGEEEVPTDSFYMWAPGEHQFYGCAEEFTHSWLHCDGDRVRRFYQTVFLKGGSLVPMPSPRSFLSFLEGVYEEILGNSMADDIIVENLLTNWMRDLNRHASGRMEYLPERLRLVRDFINEHYTEELTLGQLARLANWSVAHFSEEFRRHLGDSPINYVIRQRMQHAVYLLQDIHLSVTEVAARVGYENLYHFSKIFKRSLGESPRAYRRRHGFGAS
jgi:AraC-like DNA-binding protein